KFEFRADVIHKPTSNAARGHNVILLASGKMADDAGRKIYRSRLDTISNYVNSKDDAESLRELKQRFTKLADH
ncbi:MAG: hypothetical protein ACXVIB_06525, partial [Halobacteriota archaeon]